MRGSGGGLEPEAYTLVPPLLPWIASECAAVALATRAAGDPALASHAVALHEGPARVALGVAFIIANIVGCVLFFGVRFIPACLHPARPRHVVWGPVQRSHGGCWPHTRCAH